MRAGLSRGWLAGALLAIVVAGCATQPTTLDAQWVNPEFVGKNAVRNVMVMAAARDATNRRIFEDRMVAALRGAGLKAVQSYNFIAEDGPVSEERLRRAVAQAGVQQVMVTRIVNVSTQVNVSPGMVMGPAWGPGWAVGPGWGPGWGGFVGYHNSMWAATIPPQVTTTQNVNADTRVFDANDSEVIWSASTTTAAGSSPSVPQSITQFVDLIVATMKHDGVI